MGRFLLQLKQAVWNLACAIARVILFSLPEDILDFSRGQTPLSICAGCRNVSKQSRKSRAKQTSLSVAPVSWLWNARSIVSGSRSTSEASSPDSAVTGHRGRDPYRPRFYCLSSPRSPLSSAYADGVALKHSISGILHRNDVLNVLHYSRWVQKCKACKKRGTGSRWNRARVISNVFYDTGYSSRVLMHCQLLSHYL